MKYLFILHVLGKCIIIQYSMHAEGTRKQDRNEALI